MFKTSVMSEAKLGISTYFQSLILGCFVKSFIGIQTKIELDHLLDFLSSDHDRSYS